MYESFYGLNEIPFSLTPNPRFLFLSKTHNEVYAHLLYGVERRSGFIMVTGEIGTGKTTILRTLLTNLDESVYRVAFIFNPKLTAMELLRNIAQEFGINGHIDNLPALIEDLKDFLIAENHAGRVPVLVIDEAQNLSGDVLEQIRLLSNLETETDKLIQIVLVGQPELQKQLEDPSLRQLNQRIAVRYRLVPLNKEETRAYVLHRLKIAGRPDGNVFTKNALDKVYLASGGVPRMINMVCDRALLTAYSRERGIVSPQDVKQARAELAGEYITVSSKSGLSRWALIILTIIIASGVAWSLLESPGPVTVLEAPIVQSVSPEPVVPVTPIEPPPSLEVPVETTQQQTVPAEIAASNALLDVWGLPTVPVDANHDRFSPEVTFGLRSMQVMKLRGTFAQLQILNLPFFITRSTNAAVTDHAVVELADGGWRIVPSLDGSNLAGAADLDQLGTMDVLMPWKDFANVGNVGVPRKKNGNVLNLQRLLGMAGYLGTVPNGRYDRKTIEAVKVFQREHGLIADGMVGPRTLIVLYQVSGAYAMPSLN